ncbi:hypothetical protein OPT61_g9667 [Boeremia exigua]|uniref:Uncharacterized protein n=1 Tax=Boeremia exigua TaxID=749465 RepID=A0ACC2HT97_9PLEO|nr:hypothetical protein OPT61_g9667 [Boeremia exigua]
MYLINATTFALERFDDESSIPPYAILSHTWGNAEVTFEEVHHLRSLAGVGAWKIRQTCIQALQDGLQYAWVDTCCIDKKSSAELSEAINSMFRWYKEAAVCYACLEDADLQAANIKDLEGAYIKEPNGRLRSPHNVIDYLQRADIRWFTRGWTLQELIAPQTIVFYDKAWRMIGTRDSLRGLLSEITGIYEGVLRGRLDLDTFSVGERMSWAAKRTTTRTEDMAYSLLGIFNINMPLLYGEGEKAFARLQEEIMKDNNDQSLFAWVPSRGVPFDLAVCKDNGFCPWVKRSVPSGFRSAFALHPREFVRSNLVVPLSRYTTFALTNNGVKIKVPILPFGSRDDWASLSQEMLQATIRRDVTVVVILDCWMRSEDPPHSRVGVVYDCLDAEGLQLIRHGAAPLCLITDDDFRRARCVNVFLIKQAPDRPFYPSRL